jgi:hypothetical protein
VDAVRACHNLNHAAPVAAPAEPVRTATPKQLNFIEALGGDVHHAHSLSVSEASAYIQELKSAADALKQASNKSGSKVYDKPAHILTQFLSLLESIPEGYYAVQPDTETPLTFLRLSRPKSKNISPRWQGATKIQTIHGPNLDIAWACWPSGEVRSYKSGIEDKIMLLISNFQAAALRYAREVGHCARCNLRLTDELSRKRGVGPECIKHWSWMIGEDEQE